MEIEIPFSKKHSYKERRKRFLSFVLSKYSVPGNRAICYNQDGLGYGVLKEGKNSCPIGTFIESYPKGLDLKRLNIQYSEEFFEEYNIELNPEIKKLGQEFLKLCQELHDKSKFWNTHGGLTEEGKEFSNKIKEIFTT